MKLKVPPQYKLLILKCNSYFNVNKRLSLTRWTILYLRLDVRQVNPCDYSQVAQLVRGDDDAGEAAGVLDDGDAVDLLEALVDDARAAHVGEARRPAVALADARLAATHVQPGIWFATVSRISDGRGLELGVWNFSSLDPLPRIFGASNVMSTT